MDPEDFNWSESGERPLGSDDYSVLLIFLAFMVVIGVTSGAILLVGNAYTDYSEGMRKKELADFRRDNNVDDLEREMKPSKNPIMDDDDIDPVDKHEKFKLACLYTTDTPPPTIGCAVCLDNETGYIYVSGGIAKDDALKKTKSNIGAACDLHIYSSSERQWQHHVQNKEFGAPVHRAYHNMVTIYNQVMLFGGLNPQTNDIHNELLTFDMNNSAWIELNVKNHTPIAGGKAKMPAPRYNASMIPYGDSSFVIFGGKGRVNASSSSEHDDVMYISEEVCFNDVWVLRTDHPEYLYYEELYAHDDSARRVDTRDITASTSTVDAYKQHCAEALGKTGAVSFLKDSAAADASPDASTVASDIVPLPREAHCAAILGNNMFVFGGATVNTVYAVGGSNSNANTNASSSSSLSVTASTDTAGLKLHDEGLVEVFDLGARVWCVCNTCGEHPIGDLVGVSAHSLGDQANKIVLFSANTIEPTRPSIFNSIYVLDAALTTAADASGEPKPSLLLTWTRFVYKWLGDWSVLPTSRVFYGATLDHDEGLIYVFGGYQNYNANNADITIANGDPAVPLVNAEGNFRNSVRMNRLSKLNKNNTCIANSLKAGVNGNLKVAEIASDICVVDISPAMVFDDPPDTALPVEEDDEEGPTVRSDSARSKDTGNTAPWGDNFDETLDKPRKFSRKNAPLCEEEDEEDEFGDIIRRPKPKTDPNNIGKEFYLTDSEEDESSDAKEIERSGMVVKKKKVLVKKARMASKQGHSGVHSKPK